MPAIAVGDKIEILGLGWIGHGLKRSATGIGDRRRRQTVDLIGVIGCLLVDVRLIDRPVAGFALAAEQSVDDRRIRLQAHTLVEAIEEDRCNARALVATARFLFDNRSQGDEFVGIGQRQIGRTTLPDFIDQLFLIGKQLVDHLLAGGTARETQRVSGQAAFSRQLRRHVARQGILRGDACKRLLDRQTFRNGQ